MVLTTAALLTGCTSSGGEVATTQSQADSPADESTATTRPATSTPTAQATSVTIPDDTALPSSSFFLELIEPSTIELVVTDSDLVIGGKTLPDALITVNDDIVSPDSDGLFGAIVALEPGPNLIEVVSSVLSGETDGIVITVVYLP